MLFRYAKSDATASRSILLEIFRKNNKKFGDVQKII